MDAVTYPDANVQAAIQDHFEPLKINMLDRHPDFKEASGGQRVPWAPTFVFTEAKGREFHRYTGWLPPQAFVAQLQTVRGIFMVGQGRFDDAIEMFRQATGTDTREVTPEALYWLGIARFLAGGRDMEALAESWRELIRRFPDSRLATHTSVIEDWSD